MFDFITNETEMTVTVGDKTYRIICEDCNRCEYRFMCKTFSIAFGKDNDKDEFFYVPDGLEYGLFLIDKTRSILTLVKMKEHDGINGKYFRHVTDTPEEIIKTKKTMEGKWESDVAIYKVVRLVKIENN
jgi:hypothetical protein